MKTLVISLVSLIVVVVGYAILTTQPELLGGYRSLNVYDTTSSGFTMSQVTVNATATQVFATVDKVSYIENPTTSTIYCKLEASNTTAASSSVGTTSSVVIGPNTGTVIPSLVSFGSCDNTGTPCFRHTGAVNCLADVQKAVQKIVQ